MLVALIEDDPNVWEYVRAYLINREHHTVDAFQTMTSFLASQQQYEMALLDLNLGDSWGEATLALLRAHYPRLPVIIISAIDIPLVKISSLREGADDYLIKPFSIEELAARMQAVQRRTATLDDHRTAKGFVCDNEGRQIYKDGKEVNLTPLEYHFLLALISRPGYAWPRPQLLLEVLGPNFYGYERLVDVHIGHLRKKLGGDMQAYIETVRSLGYRWNAETPVRIVGK